MKTKYNIITKNDKKITTPNLKKIINKKLSNIIKTLELNTNE